MTVAATLPPLLVERSKMGFRAGASLRLVLRLSVQLVPKLIGTATSQDLATSNWTSSW
jgi:hypothetical protein